MVPSWLKWLGGMLLVGLSGLALILHKMSGSRTLANAAINAIEAAHQPHIEVLNAQLDLLSKQGDVDQKAIDKAQSAVDSRKQDLKVVYDHVGLTPDQVDERLANMKV